MKDLEPQRIKPGTNFILEDTPLSSQASVEGAADQSAEQKNLSFIENLKKTAEAYEAEVIKKISGWDGGRKLAKENGRSFMLGGIGLMVTGIILKIMYSEIQDPVFNTIMTVGMGTGGVASLGAMVKPLIDMAIIMKHDFGKKDAS